ncbi:MAG: hypothetical protein M1816_003468 [Peltula sp. TS41687]|nr:MAG: hypothetical protein M1816_003468 [Peltula sp. TS41687]
MSNQHVFALTICAYRKAGMDEDEYHKYVSEKHAPSLKDLLVKNKIIDYTVLLDEQKGKEQYMLTRGKTKQHNTRETRDKMNKIFGDLPAAKVADHDSFIQIIFKDDQDYINVMEDPHYKQVVNPDHANFADLERTTMVIGWLERHVVGGKAA